MVRRLSILLTVVFMFTCICVLMKLTWYTMEALNDIRYDGAKQTALLIWAINTSCAPSSFSRYPGIEPDNRIRRIISRNIQFNEIIKNHQISSNLTIFQKSVLVKRIVY